MSTTLQSLDLAELATVTGGTKRLSKKAPGVPQPGLPQALPGVAPSAQGRPLPLPQPMANPNPYPIATNKQPL